MLPKNVRRMSISPGGIRAHYINEGDDYMVIITTITINNYRKYSLVPFRYSY